LEDARSQMSEQANRVLEQELELSRQEGRLAEVQDRLEASELEASSQKTDLDQKSFDLEDARSQMSEQAKRVLEQELELTRHEGQLAEVRDRLQASEMEASSRKTDLDQKSFAVEELSLELQSSQERVQEQQSRAERHAATIEDQKFLLEQLRSAVKRHEELNVEQSGEMKELDRQLSSSKQSVKDLERHATGQTEKMVAQKLELEALGEQLDVCQQEMQQKDEKFSAQATELEQQRGEVQHGQELGRQKAAIVEAQALQVEELRAEIEARGDCERGLLAQVHALEAKTSGLEGVREELVEAMRRIAEQELEMDVRAHELEQARLLVDEQTKELDDLRVGAEDSAKLGRCVEQLRTQVVAQEQQLEVAQSKATATEAEVTEARATVQAQHEQLMVRDLEMKERLEDMELTVERLKALQQYTEGLESDLDGSREAAEENEALRQGLEASLKAARGDLHEERRRAEDHLARTLELAQELEEFSLVGGPSEELRTQNRELVLTVNQFKRDAELLDAEARGLKDRLAVFETDLERVQGQHAELTGHINHKQKIKHTMQLKEEISSLRTKLTQAYQRITKLEVDNFGVDFFEALASLGMSLCQGELSQAYQTSCQNGNLGGGCSPRLTTLAAPRSWGGSVDHPRASAVTPYRQRKASTGQFSGRGSPSGGGALVAAEQLQDFAALAVQYQNMERRCFLQQRALEKVSIDFGHFLALIERSVFLAEGGASGEPGVSSPKVQRSLPDLMRKLRDVIADAQGRRATSPMPLAVEAAAADPPQGASPHSPDAAASAGGGGPSAGASPQHKQLQRWSSAPVSAPSRVATPQRRAANRG